MSEENQLPYKMKLEHPVQFGEELVEELEFVNPLTAGDMWDMPAQNQKLGDSFKLVGKMTARPLSFVKKLQAADIVEASRFVQSFLPDGPITE